MGDSEALDRIDDLLGMFDAAWPQVPTWAWLLAAGVLLWLITLPLRRRSGRGRSGARKPRSTRGDGERELFAPEPGRYGPQATRDLTMAEVEGLQPRYAPAPNGLADPGEVVWTWVPYAENNGEGKDRPVLIIARIDGAHTAGCYLSTKAHRGYVSLGSGAWDRSGRESFLAPERILSINNLAIRREAQVVPREVFERALAEIKAAQKRRLRHEPG
ncbi:type II toxin-antitoxin system PemK/MazF family toxin [Leucobacter sp. HY1910]